MIECILKINSMINKSEIKITNAWICQVSENQITPIFGDVIFAQGRITDIQEKSHKKIWSKPPSKADNVLDAAGRVLTLPQINFHDHFYSRLVKGLPLSGPMDNFFCILENLWWKVDRALDLEMVQACAQMAALESIKNGVTYIFDHHVSPDATAGSLPLIRDTLEQFGLRGVLCFETSDRNGTELADLALRENENFLRDFTSNNFKGMMGLHASFTISDQTLKKAADIVQKYNAGIHIHLCEDKVDRELSLQKYSKFPAQRLVDFYLLNPKSILSHGVHMDEDDYSLISQSGAAIAYNSDSNMNNAVGLPQIKHVPLSTPILMGTDGMHANVARSLKQQFLVLRHAGSDFEYTFNYMHKIFFDQLCFIEKYFPDFPSLKIGDRADMILWDYVPPTPFSVDNFWGHFIYGMVERNIHSVVHNGKVLLKNFQLVGADSSAIYENIYQQGRRLFEKIKN